MVVFAHHTEAFFTIEINGRNFPDGMTEHALGAGIAAFALSLMAYGAFSVVRDWLRWRGKRSINQTPAAQLPA